MSKYTADQVQSKWARRLKGATEDIRDGVASVTEAPGVAAAKKADKMKQNIVQAIESGKWQKRVSAVSLDEWKSKMLEKGLTRVASGVDGASGKMQQFYSELLPYQDKLKSEIAKLPDLTLEDSISRMTTWIRGMSKFKRG